MFQIRIAHVQYPRVPEHFQSDRAPIERVRVDASMHGWPRAASALCVVRLGCRRASMPRVLFASQHRLEITSRPPRPPLTPFPPPQVHPIPSPAPIQPPPFPHHDTFHPYFQVPMLCYALCCGRAEAMLCHAIFVFAVLNQKT